MDEVLFEGMNKRERRNAPMTARAEPYRRLEMNPTKTLEKYDKEFRKIGQGLTMKPLQLPQIMSPRSMYTASFYTQRSVA